MAGHHSWAANRYCFKLWLVSTRGLEERAAAFRFQNGNQWHVTKMHDAMPQNISFLVLPAEIRNKVYRYCLVTEYVTSCVPNPAYNVVGNATELKIVDGEWPKHDDEEEDEEGFGIVRCDPIYIQKSAYNMSLLRVNRQIFEEAYSVFCRENYWITVQSNRVQFLDCMIDKGFPIKRSNGEPNIKDSILDLRAMFGKPSSSSRHGTCAVATQFAACLPRTLFTSTGMHALSLRFRMNERCLSMEKSHLEKVLLDLHDYGSFARTSVDGPGLDEDLFDQMSSILIPKPSVRIFRARFTAPYVVTILLRRLNKIIRNDLQMPCEKVADKCERMIAFVLDCFQTYSSCILNNGNSHFGKICKIVVQAVAHLSNVRFQQCQYRDCVKLATWGLSIELRQEEEDKVLRAQLLVLQAQACRALGDCDMALNLLDNFRIPNDDELSDSREARLDFDPRKVALYEITQLRSNRINSKAGGEHGRS